MNERVFLGWDEPFLTKAVNWLLERRDELPHALVVAPTAQSGRRLREALAAQAGALLAPRVVTPGSFLKIHQPEVAEDWVDQIAWLEALESIDDWKPYSALFPTKPDDDNSWASGLAREMVKLRRSLQENGLTLNIATRKLSDTVEAERWQALGKLETIVEQYLKSWGFKSRSHTLTEGLNPPTGINHIILAGVTEMPPLVERSWLAWDLKITSLIGAPPSEAATFSPCGRPLETWADRPLPWPSGTTGSVQVTADPRQQAIEALKIVSNFQTMSHDIALGSADADVGAELARTFTRSGWPAFHPAETPIASGLARWFKIWSAWLTDPTLATMADLLTMPETGIIISGKRAQKAKLLSQLRDRWMILRCEDLHRRISAASFRNEWDENSANDLLATATSLEKWRNRFQNDDFSETILNLLETLARTGSTTEENSQAMIAWITAAKPMMARVRRSPVFWIELMVAGIPSPAPLPPEGRVVDIQGWLELFHEPGCHLILCGMNEGKVPARSGGEPWLSEASRDRLGLIKDSERAARDAFLYQAMLEARRNGGRVDLICGKSGAGGDSLLPSRLMLAAQRDELPARVRTLFQEIEPPDAGLRWEKDWQWQPRKVEPPKRINATSLTDYLNCPFRYYLKHAVNMRGTETGRSEWTARDFGTIAHEVLERWAHDDRARDSDDANAIHQLLSRELDRVVNEWFDQRIPLAVRVQTEAMRQRLLWLARVQARERANGWEIIDVERKVEIPVGQSVIVAKLDRIDRHRESGKLRVIDYKTGKVDGVEKAHRKKIKSTTTLPSHFTLNDPVVYETEEKGKSSIFRWHNLQLPLYAAAVSRSEKILPTPCYLTITPTESEVELHEWTDFDDQDLAAAQACADWVAERIAAGIFWPPAEKVAYDDYQILAAGRSFEEMICQSHAT